MDRSEAPGPKALSFLPLQEALLFYDVTEYFLMKWHKQGYIKIKRTEKNERLFEIDAGIPLRVKCTKRQKKLCKKKNCKICPERSFENHPKAEFWSETNEKTPRDLSRGSHDLVWFTCNNCPHEFQTELYNITASQWCPFCCNNSKKLCDDKDCDFCKKRSFLSEPKAIFWSETNEKNPREVLKGSSTGLYWFNCNNCPHEFQTELYNITAGQWCPFCCNNSKKLCDDKDCDFCKKRSFLSEPKAIFWSEQNKLKPRDFLKGSGELVWFNCRHGHEFQSRLSNIKAGHWCPACKNKTEQKLFEWLKNIYPSDDIITP